MAYSSVHLYSIFFIQSATDGKGNEPDECRQEGVLGLWRGLGPNVARNAIVNAAELASFDQVYLYCAATDLPPMSMRFKGKMDLRNL